MMDSSAGVSLEAMLLAMAALSLISEPVSMADVAGFDDGAGALVVLGAVEDVSLLPNHEDT